MRGRGFESTLRRYWAWCMMCCTGIAIRGLQRFVRSSASSCDASRHERRHKCSCCTSSSTTTSAEPTPSRSTLVLLTRARASSPATSGRRIGVSYPAIYPSIPLTLQPRRLPAAQRARDLGGARVAMQDGRTPAHGVARTLPQLCRAAYTQAAGGAAARVEEGWGG